MILRPLLICALLPVALSAAAPRYPPAEAVEPVRYTGARGRQDALRRARAHAVGVHNIQAMRANRTHPPGHITIHLQSPAVPGLLAGYLSPRLSALFRIRAAHQHLGHELGRRPPWSPPRVVFPEYILPEIKRDGVDIRPA